jgi:hypothetical protein
VTGSAPAERGKETSKCRPSPAACAVPTEIQATAASSAANLVPAMTIDSPFRAPGSVPLEATMIEGGNSSTEETLVSCIVV